MKAVELSHVMMVNKFKCDLSENTPSFNLSLIHQNADQSPISYSGRLTNISIRCTIGLNQILRELFKSGQYLLSTKRPPPEPSVLNEFG